MKILTAALMFMSCALIGRGAPISDTEAIEYLVRYGYMDPNLPAAERKMALKRCLQDFQELMGLEKSGELGKETQEIMQRVRCGVLDKYDFVNNMRLEKKTYAKTKWNFEEVTYRIYRYPRNFTYAAVDEVFTQAFHMWSNFTNLNFRQVNGMADINIGFVSQEHGDGHPFVGGRTYAHAWKPPVGVVHFDADSSWSIRNSSGDDLLMVAVHEIGHALGLTHIFNRKAIMWPVVDPIFSTGFGLHAADIEKIQELYGKKKNTIPDLCSNSSIDAIFEYPTGVIYIFKGDYYWKLTPDGIASGYPRLISHRWPGVPGNVDAATATSLGETYFFKGNQFWKFYHTTPCNTNPTYISMGWPGMPENVDAVTWRGHSLFYFFKGDQYWQYDASQYHEHRYSWAKPITDWGGITGDVDDVLYVSNGYFYIFSRGIYYRYNCMTGLIDYGPPSYPRSVAKWWFRCYKTPNFTPTSADITTQEIYTESYDKSAVTTEDSDFTSMESGSGSDDFDDITSTTEVDVITEITTDETYTDDTTSTEETEDFLFLITDGESSGDDFDHTSSTTETDVITEITTDETYTDDTTSTEETEDFLFLITDGESSGDDFDHTSSTTETDVITEIITDETYTDDTTSTEITDFEYITGSGSGDETDDDKTTMEATDDIYIDEIVTVSEDSKITSAEQSTIDVDGNITEDITDVTTEEEGTYSGSGSGSGDGDDTEMTDESETTTYTEEPTIPPEGSELIEANANNLFKAERLSMEEKNWSSNAECSSFSSFLVGLMAIMGQLHRIQDP